MIHTAQDMKTYKKRLKESLDDRFLQTTLTNFSTSYRQAREKAFEGLDFDLLREEISQNKDAALPRLEELFEIFKKNAEQAGIKIHFAKDAKEANSIISEIASAGGVKNIVKSKTMTGEEIFINDHLEKQGFKVTETDLGEWIIQLRKEGPSHMVMPAIHLSRQEVAHLFSDVTGDHMDPDDIDGMVKVARKKLRQAFLEADMGISGANFAIAESATIGIISNEGNARLTTTLPRIHVALVGIDKLVPDLKTALNILRVLPKNATGQAISSYVTWITGPVPCAVCDSAKKQMHIVFLDNGRLKLAKNPVFSEVLRCIRCGACANVCPIYRLVGGHKYGHVYIGAIGLILTYFYHGRENARAIVQNCLNCHACKAVCPAGIHLPSLIKKVYENVLKQEPVKPAKNMLMSAVLKNRKLFHFLLRQAYIAQKPFADSQGFLRHLPLFFTKEHKFRTLPAIAKIPLRDQWESIKPKVSSLRLRVALFGGCVIDFVYPEQAIALLKLLSGENIGVEYPMEQTCCGLPAMMAAEFHTAKSVAAANLNAINPDNYDYILTLCASCGSHLKESYPTFFEDNSALREKAEKFSKKVIDFSSFMVNVLGVMPEQFEKQGITAAYHAPCHLCRGLKVSDEPRKLLEISGIKYIPSKEEDVCCGFGGSYSVQFPEISSRILERKLSHVAESGAQYLVTDCPGCVMQLRGGMDKQKINVKVKHIAELVAEGKKSDSTET